MNDNLYRSFRRNVSVVTSTVATVVSLSVLVAWFLRDVGPASFVVSIVTGIIASIGGAVIAYSTAKMLRLLRRETPSVFISYSHLDSDFAEKLSRGLRKIDVNPILDRIELKVGDNIRTAVDDMIDKSDYFVFIISPNSAKSDWTKKEIDQASKRQKKILPVVLDASSIPPELSGIYYADFTKDFDGGINQLRKAFKPASELSKAVAAIPRTDWLTHERFIFLKREIGDIAAPLPSDAILREVIEYLMIGERQAAAFLVARTTQLDFRATIDLLMAIEDKIKAVSKRGSKILGEQQKSSEPTP